ncbi:MAG: CCA tRNA nucleotidyltransferase [Eubacteriales bacterium]|nr:CCA tRNA nucleotidyltransferase [Eubacteriales bacterium]
MSKEIEIVLPEAVRRIIETLQGGGFEAWAVGGCIRDSILGRQPDDWDITTSARPEQVKALFKRTVDTGIQHGTVTVLQDKTGYEVTTYRIDGKYEDGRHPKEVTFTASLREDLRRRDFTINAMAYNDTVGLVDIFGGLEDIEKKVVRCVGDPVERFTEDALRMMRAVRFSAQLGYRIDEGTLAAIAALSGTLEKISAERIRTELVKLLTSPHPELLRVCRETGMTAVFLPEFDRIEQTPQNNPHHCWNVGEHTVRALMASAPEKTLRLALLFHDMGKALTRTTDAEGVDHFHGHEEVSARIAREAMRRLKFDNETIDRVVRLVRAHDVRIEPGEKYMRRALNRLGSDLFPELFRVKAADMSAQSDYLRKEKEARLERMYRDYEAVLKSHACVSLKDLAVNGRDLIAAGMQPGPQLGEVLQELLELVLEEPERNTREYLMEQAKKRE